MRPIMVITETISLETNGECDVINITHYFT
jgi:hypothetical protein